MGSGSLRQRLARIPELTGRPELDRVAPAEGPDDTGDPDAGPVDGGDLDDAALDEVARVLVERFRRERDVEAFTLLFELTHDRLLAAAARIARQLGPTADPEDLVAGFMARLFCDVGRRPSGEVRRFLGFAHTSMRNDMLDQLRRQRRAVAKRRTYADTLAVPPSPVDLIESAEERRALMRCGLRLLEITGACFDELDARDRQVLMAREILALPYDRVASMLQLAPDQVGMIIRRARKHLVDRILVNLARSGGQDDDDARRADDISRLQRSLGADLDDKRRTRSVRVLLERMLALSKASGRAALSDLLYEMAKACLAARPDFAERTLATKAPRRPELVADDIREMTGRLARVDRDGAPPHLEQVVAAAPRRETAIDDTRRCLEKLEELEGPSGRQRVALALAEIHDGHPELGEEILRDLDAHADEYGLTLVTRQNVSRNITLALLRQARWAEALATAEAAAVIWPDDPVRVTNACFAAARLMDARGFESHVRHLAAICRRQPAPLVQAWLDGPVHALAQDLGLAPGRVDALIAEAARMTVVAPDEAPDADDTAEDTADDPGHEEGA